MRLPRPIPATHTQLQTGAARFMLGIPMRAGFTEAQQASCGLLVWSIVPIALAYHIAHYLPSLLVDGQYAVAALSDPFGYG